MSTVIELVPQTRLVAEDYTQPIESIVDVSEHIGLGVSVHITKYVQSGGSGVAVYLATAMENADERYVRLARICNLTASTSDEEVHYAFFSGPGSVRSDDSPPNDSVFLGVGRYVRIEVEGLVSGDSLIFSAHAIPRN